MRKECEIIIDEKSYPVIIDYKRIKNAYFRYKDGTFFITSSYLIPKGSLLKSLRGFAPRLLKTKKESIPYSFEEDFIYIFGEKFTLSSLKVDENHLEKYLKKLLLNYLNERVNYFKELMSITHTYKVKVRNMKTRHGSNSRKTMTLTFQSSLIHFSKDIIDSVVIHELAHDKEFNHSKSFYNIVYKYSPNYKILKRKLDKGIYS